MLIKLKKIEKDLICCLYKKHFFVISDENAAGLQRGSANHAEILSSFASHTILILSWCIYFFFATSFCQQLT